MDHQEPQDNPDEKLLLQDVDGTAANPALSIKGTPGSGGAGSARISRKSPS